MLVVLAVCAMFFLSYFRIRAQFHNSAITMNLASENSLAALIRDITQLDLLCRLFCVFAECALKPDFHLAPKSHGSDFSCNDFPRYKARHDLHVLLVCIVLVLHQKINDFYSLFVLQRNVEPRKVECIPTFDGLKFSAAKISSSQLDCRKFHCHDIFPRGRDPA